MRRPLISLLVIVAVLTLTAALVFLVRDPHAGEHVTRENCARIQVGMTEAQVEDILGCRPGYYGRTPWFMNRKSMMTRVSLLGLYWRDWQSDAVHISIGFDEQTGLVKFVFPHDPP